MMFPKSPAHSDLKTVLNFIPRLKKTKVVEKTMSGRQNSALIYFDKITMIQIDKFKIFLIFNLLPIKTVASYCQLIMFHLIFN